MVTNIEKEEYMVEQPKLLIHGKSEDSNIKIRTDKAQRVDMFGGAITHSTALLLDVWKEWIVFFSQQKTIETQYSFEFSIVFFILSYLYLLCNKE